MKTFWSERFVFLSNENLMDFALGRLVFAANVSNMASVMSRE
jgi:hypothetical protein